MSITYMVKVETELDASKTSYFVNEGSAQGFFNSCVAQRKASAVSYFQEVESTGDYTLIKRISFVAIPAISHMFKKKPIKNTKWAKRRKPVQVRFLR